MHSRGWYAYIWGSVCAGGYTHINTQKLTHGLSLPMHTHTCRGADEAYTPHTHTHTYTHTGGLTRRIKRSSTIRPILTAMLRVLMTFLVGTETETEGERERDSHRHTQALTTQYVCIIYICMFIYACVCVCVYVCVYVCVCLWHICVYMYICLYMFIWPITGKILRAGYGLN